MITKELAEHIKENLQKGIAPADITEFLMEQGWSHQELIDALEQIKNQTSPSNTLENLKLKETTPEIPNNISPYITIDYIKNPNVFFSLPLIGGVGKVIILIPIFVEVIFLFLINILVLPIVSIFIFTKGKYSVFAYKLNCEFLKLSIETFFYIYGLTNNYPGFIVKAQEPITVVINFPNFPNRLFAIPVISTIIRFIILFPYLLYALIFQLSAFLWTILSSFPIFFHRYYPKSVFELAKDSVRIQHSYLMFLFGLCDKYPSFHLSINYKYSKFILVVIGTLIMLTAGFFVNSQLNNPNLLNNINWDSEINFLNLQQ